MQRGRQDETPTQFGPFFDRTELVASDPRTKDAITPASSKAEAAVSKNPLITANSKLDVKYCFQVVYYVGTGSRFRDKSEKWPVKEWGGLNLYEG